MPPGVDREPAQERAGSSAGWQLRRLTGDLDFQLAEHSDLKHGCRHSRLASPAHGSLAYTLTCALTVA